MKSFNLVFSILLITVLCFFTNISVKAIEEITEKKVVKEKTIEEKPLNYLKMDDTSSPDYLINHGHSPEIIRLVETQQNKTLTKDEKIKTNNKFVKFWKNIFYERTITLPLDDFGYSTIKTPEAR